MLFSILITLSIFASLGTAVKLTVSATGGNATSPLQYGIMFEDISHSGDGGIYAELIQNRAFQGNPSSVYPWEPVGNATLSLTTTSPISAALPTSIQVHAANTGTIGLKNPGWWGIDVKPQKYVGSFWVYGLYHGSFTASLQSALTGQVWATTQVNRHSISNGWTQHHFTLTPKVSAPNSNNTFSITFSGGYSLNFHLISLFPPTYNNRYVREKI
jgi:alpha-L-arabinofuranosidase